mmetsp:Transcript_10484/g.23826  ORF Transcript_10484/g.23826 Transcript_10484/m.23826 type:complete len:884 (+) Transcript_10484:63-2714(+)
MSAEEMFAAFKSWRDDGKRLLPEENQRDSAESFTPITSPDRAAAEALQVPLAVWEGIARESPARHGIRSTLSLGRRLLQEELRSETSTPQQSPRRRPRTAILPGKVLACPVRNGKAASPERPPGVSANRAAREALAAELNADTYSATQASMAMVGVVRGELDMFESRLQEQLATLQDGVGKMITRSEKLREAEVARLEQKVSSAEISNSRLERRLAEFGGAVKGVTSEMETQIRRTDSMDATLTDFKKRVQEDSHHRSTIMEQTLQDVITKCQTSILATEAEQTRVATKLDHRLAELEATANDGWREEVATALFTQLYGSNEASKDLSRGTEARGDAKDANIDAPDGELRLWQVERDLSDLQEKVNVLTAEVFGDSGWGSRLQEHEVHLKAIQCKHSEARQIDDRSRLEVEARVEQALKLGTDAKTRATAATEEFEACKAKLEFTIEENKVEAAELRRDVEAALARPAQGVIQEAALATARGEVESLVCELLKPWSQAVEALRGEVAALADQVMMDTSRPSQHPELPVDTLELAAQVKDTLSTVAQIKADVNKCFASMREQDDQFMAQDRVLQQQIDALALSPDKAAAGVRHPEEYLQLLDECATQEQLLKEKVGAADKLLTRMGGIASLYSDSQTELETILQNLKTHEQEVLAQESVLQRQIDTSANLMQELQYKAIGTNATAGDRTEEGLLQRLNDLELQEHALRAKVATAEKLLGDLETQCEDGLQGAIAALNSRTEVELKALLEHLKGHESEFEAQEAVLKQKVVHADSMLARLELLLPTPQLGGEYAAQLGGEMEAIVSGMRAREDESKAQELVLRDRVVALEGMLAHLEHEVSTRMPTSIVPSIVVHKASPVFIPRKSLSNMDDVLPQTEKIDEREA